MSGRLFGTDGVRGLANRDLTAELALSLSAAAAHVLGDTGALASGGGRPTAVVGRDPRASGQASAGAESTPGSTAAATAAVVTRSRLTINPISSAAPR